MRLGRLGPWIWSCCLLAACTDRALDSEGLDTDVGTTGDSGDSADSADSAAEGTGGTTGAPTTTSTPTTSSPTSSTTSSSTSTSSTSSDGASTGIPAVECSDMCHNLVDGSCIGMQDSCELTCADVVGDQGPAVADAFEDCVATEPLCFSWLEDCMWSQLYDAPVQQTYVFEGSAFAAFEGATVYSALVAEEQTHPGTSATIVGGAFEVEVSAVLSFDRFFNQRLLFVFVDVDDDGLCTPGIDFGHSEYLQLDDEFSEPSFSYQGTAGDTSADHVCDYF